MRQSERQSEREREGFKNYITKGCSCIYILYVYNKCVCMCVCVCVCLTREIESSISSILKAKSNIWAL